MQLRARHLKRARLVRDSHADLALVVRCPSCGGEGALLTGADAAQALRRGLTYLNASRGARRRAEVAAREVDQVGGPDRLIHDVSRRELTLRALRPERRIALEMAVDELAEITELERQWQDAEEIAAIADGSLSTCNRSENPELFSLVIGGYGLLGVVTRVRLRLSRRTKLERVVRIVDIDDLMPAFAQLIGEGYL